MNLFLASCFELLCRSFLRKTRHQFPRSRFLNSIDNSSLKAFPHRILRDTHVNLIILNLPNTLLGGRVWDSDHQLVRPNFDLSTPPGHPVRPDISTTCHLLTCSKQLTALPQSSSFPRAFNFLKPLETTRPTVPPTPISGVGVVIRQPSQAARQYVEDSGSAPAADALGCHRSCVLPVRTERPLRSRWVREYRWEAGRRWF